MPAPGHSSAPPPAVSVIVCTHNPRAGYLERAIAALAAQTLPLTAWELLLIDNASRDPVAGRVDLSWHPLARHVYESALGLTQARLRGIAEAKGEMFVWVDDDNVLQSDYLATALTVARQRPWLGAWGGRVIGEFEIEPPAWARPHLGCLALRDVDRDHWGNSVTTFEAVPNGAGMCVRAAVAHAWAKKILADPVRSGLGRKGDSLSSSEDTDLAWTACDLGLGTGIFVQLRLTHLIPKERLTLGYFERLLNGVAASHVFLQNGRSPIRERGRQSLMLRAFRQYQLWRMSGEERRLQTAIDRGRDAAYRRLGF
jgi:hypothetical protein